MTRYLRLVRGKQGEAVSHMPLPDTVPDSVARADVIDLSVEDCTCAMCVKAYERVDNLPAPIVEIRARDEGISDFEGLSVEWSPPISDDGSATLNFMADEGLLDWVSVEGVSDCE